VLDFAALLPSFFAQDSFLESASHMILMRFAQQQEGRKRDSRVCSPLEISSIFLGGEILTLVYSFEMKIN
jgi:hypothetical protein